MLSLISFIFVLSVLVIVHEFGHFIVAKKTGVKVEKFSIGFGKELFGITKDETRYSISLIPLGGYVKLKGETEIDESKKDSSEYLSRSVGERLRIIFAGPLLNYILAFFIFSFVFIIGSPALTSKIGKVLPGYPGELSGLKNGDRILKINGKSIKYWDDVTGIIHTNKSGKMLLTIDRSGNMINVEVLPKSEDMPTIYGSKRKVGIVGILPDEEIVMVKYNIPVSFYMGGKKLISLTYMTVRALWATVVGAIPFKDSVAGPIAIFNITGQAAKLGFVYLLQLMGILSMSLAIFNLLPIPVLDGGHILFLFIEKLRGKPVSIKVQENITQVGFGLLILLMVFVSYNDLAKSGIFNKVTSLWHK